VAFNAAMRRLETVSEIIDAVGGAAKFSRDLEGYGLSFKRSRIANWPDRKRFPPETRDALSTILREIYSIDAPPSLWGQVEIDRARS
jgi:hypothetical protein